MLDIFESSVLGTLFVVFLQRTQILEFTYPDGNLSPDDEILDVLVQKQVSGLLALLFLNVFQKQKLHPLPAHLPPSLASSAVWSIGPGQIAKHVQPSLPHLLPPSRFHPDSLLFSCATRRRFQPGQMFNTDDNMFAPRCCL